MGAAPRLKKPDDKDLGHHLAEAEKAALAGREHVLSLRAFLKGWQERFGQELIEDVVIPHRTFMRRKARKENLNEAETDRALRVARVALHADRVFHGRARAQGWLNHPNAKFSGRTPFSLLKTEPGYRLVEETLFQIEHGIFA
jgi:putative toxin-antitoxin system antitoxin component (TIGR02293 family)